MNQNDPPYFDVTPHLRLFIDKDGRWYQNGAEIIHPGIRRQFMEALEISPVGGYRIRVGREVCQVEVEDAPYVVVGIVDNGDGNLSLELKDGAKEVFDPETFWINDQNIPYSMVRNGEFPARFSRPAYYELAQRIVSDEENQSFSLVLNGKSWPVRREAAP